ncbi:Uncharacterised protein [Chlamydia trachomatis]|nr:Uncharacterised protein [Chlamydia trachomatis]
MVLSGVLPEVENILLKCKFDERLGRENICSHINLALERAKAIVAEERKSKELTLQL